MSPADTGALPGWWQRYGHLTEEGHDHGSSPGGVPRYPVRYVKKTWGHERWIVNNQHYCGKFLHLAAKGIGSLHYHERKTETFYLMFGLVDLEVGDQKYRLLPGRAVDIPPGVPHRFVGIVESLIIEFSTTHDDADTVRLVEAPPA